jgi:hypothetical protein
MDAELTEWGCACVGELVGSFGRDDDDVAARDGQCFCADNKRDHTFLDDKNFFVGMDMERGTLSWLRMDQEKGSRSSVVSSFKAIRGAVGLKITKRNGGLHAFFLSSDPTMWEGTFPRIGQPGR